MRICHCFYVTNASPFMYIHQALANAVSPAGSLYSPGSYLSVKRRCALETFTLVFPWGPFLLLCEAWRCLDMTRLQGPNKITQKITKRERCWEGISGICLLFQVPLWKSMAASRVWKEECNRWRRKLLKNAAPSPMVFYLFGGSYGNCLVRVLSFPKLVSVVSLWFMFSVLILLPARLN